MARRTTAEDAWTGIVAAVLFVAGFGLLAIPPSPDAPPREVVEYLLGHRERIFAAACLIGAGAALFVWFLAAVRRFVGDDRRGAIEAGVLGGQGGTVLVLAAMGLLAGLALHVGELAAPRPTALAFDAYNALVTIAGFLFALAAAGTAVAADRNRTLSGRVVTAGKGVAVLQLATVPGLFAQSGAFAAGGPVALLAFWALAAWFVVVALGMRAEAATTPPDAARGARIATTDAAPTTTKGTTA